MSRLLWFNHGFMKAETQEGQLRLLDLPMGMEPDYIFVFAVAERDGQVWRPIRVQQLIPTLDAARQLPRVWRRIWSEPDAATPTPP